MKWRDLAVIRSSRDGFLVLLDDEGEFGAVLGQLRQKLQSASGFFGGAEVTVDVGRRELNAGESAQLASLLREEHGIALHEVMSGSPEHRRARSEDVVPFHNLPGGGEGGDVARGDPRPAASVTPERPRQREERTLFINRTLRSGQRIHHEGSVVILGDVNPGAEVVAGGDIIVMGAFRGVAHAGARGRAHAVIAATSLAPTQLRIAGYIGRAPDEGAQVRLRPEMALVREGMVVIEPCPGRPLG
ncbi:MAG: septum site-determining protein MinC [Armatimonadetes bacterium]|nr:septum site-determining protein MinC [Armatimonadota bacterium]